MRCQVHLNGAGEPLLLEAAVASHGNLGIIYAVRAGRQSYDPTKICAQPAGLPLACLERYEQKIERGQRSNRHPGYRSRLR